MLGAKYMAKKVRCEASRDCKQLVEVNLTWSVHSKGLDNPATRTGGNFCGSCAAIIWERVSQVPFACGTAICEEPMWTKKD